MDYKKKISLNDHIAVGNELKIAQDALQKAEIIIHRTDGRTKKLYGMISLILDGLMRIISQADDEFFEKYPHREYSPYYGDHFTLSGSRPDRRAVTGAVTPVVSVPPSTGRPCLIFHGRPNIGPQKKKGKGGR